MNTIVYEVSSWLAGLMTHQYKKLPVTMKCGCSLTSCPGHAKCLTNQLERAYAIASHRATASPNVSVRSPVGPDDVTAAAAAAKEAWYKQRRQYRQLRRRKNAEFRRLRLIRIHDHYGSQLRPHASKWFDRCWNLQSVYWFIAEKVSKVRSTTSGAVPPTFSCIEPGVSFAAFSSVSVDDVNHTVR